MSNLNTDVTSKMMESKKDSDPTQQKEQKQKGKLKIFFGYAAGVGKTYAMLEAAHSAKDNGIDVVIGYVEPHARPETIALVSGLETISNKNILYKNITLKEFDIDSALKRKPELIIVDELAHTNAPGCRHSKRYQDIQELLNAGINVYTTVNVQHLESINDQVEAITGVKVKERIPDTIFNDADQVELIDIEPSDLISRLKDGKVYKSTQSASALSHFFIPDNLIALREISLRRCADRVSRTLEIEKAENTQSGYTNEHILVCLSSSPSNEKIIRTASKLAFAYRAEFTALYVTQNNQPPLTEENRKRLDSNIKLARQLGAKIETVYGDDIATIIGNYARQFRASKIVLGRSGNRNFLGLKPTLVDKLINENSDLDIYIIPDKTIIQHKAKQPFKYSKAKSDKKTNIHDLFVTLITTIISTLLGFILFESGLTDVNIVTIYIFGVLVNGLLTKGVGFSFLSSLISVLAFNYFFTEPRFTLHAYGVEYPFTFLIMFLSGFFTSSLTKRIKAQSSKSMETAYRTKLLFELNRELIACEDEKKIIDAAVNHLSKLLNRNIVYYPVFNKKLKEPIYYVKDEKEKALMSNEEERTTAKWVCINNKSAGATTDTLSSSRCLYYAVRVKDSVYGVIGIEMEDKHTFVGLEENITLAMLGETAIAIEKFRIEKEKEEARTIAKNEQMKTNILRAISHDLRTPLSCISGNADLLLHSNEGKKLTDKQKNEIEMAIHDDSMYLINLVENLLSVTRIEDGTMRLRLSPEVVDEVIAEAIKHIHRYGENYKINVVPNDDIIIANMDARLIVQVIINMIDNAIKYAGNKAEVTLSTEKRGKEVVINIADNGPGVPDEEKSRIFELFYTAHNKLSDSRRSMGLGLALCKSIIQSHNGNIFITDNKPKGSIFSFTLPLQEVFIDE